MESSIGEGALRGEGKSLRETGEAPITPIIRYDEYKFFNPSKMPPFPEFFCAIPTFIEDDMDTPDESEWYLYYDMPSLIQVLAYKEE